jgi:hypothetical protein
MTFRLMNLGRAEVWHQTEFMYHTWHPGSDGIDNYLGPHDGRNMSTTALDALCTGRVMPLAENAAVRILREQRDASADGLLRACIDAERYQHWRRPVAIAERAVAKDENDLRFYRGFRIFGDGEGFYAHLAIDEHRGRAGRDAYLCYLEDARVPQLKARIDAAVPRATLRLAALVGFFVGAWRGGVYLLWKIWATAVRLCKLAARGFRRVFRIPEPPFPVVGEAMPPESDILRDVLPMLYFLGRKESAPAVTAVIQRRKNELCLRLLSMLGVIPGVSVVRLERMTDVERFLSRWEWSDRHKLLLGRKLYLRFYHLVPRIGTRIATY